MCKKFFLTRSPVIVFLHAAEMKKNARWAHFFFFLEIVLLGTSISL